uniref:Uncharacterized protein n=1 Tax=Oryza rufipogon TaxID=4529 RepID=A0A0E0R646_ORYRU
MRRAWSDLELAGHSPIAALARRALPAAWRHLHRAALLRCPQPGAISTRPRSTSMPASASPAARRRSAAARARRRPRPSSALTWFFWILSGRPDVEKREEKEKKREGKKDVDGWPTSLSLPTHLRKGGIGERWWVAGKELLYILGGGGSAGEVEARRGEVEAKMAQPTASKTRARRRGRGSGWVGAGKLRPLTMSSPSPMLCMRRGLLLHPASCCIACRVVVRAVLPFQCTCIRLCAVHGGLFAELLEDSVVASLPLLDSLHSDPPPRSPSSPCIAPPSGADKGEGVPLNADAT